jgi:hypothetical protein
VIRRVQDGCKHQHPPQASGVHSFRGEYVIKRIESEFFPNHYAAINHDALSKILKFSPYIVVCLIFSNFQATLAGKVRNNLATVESMTRASLSRISCRMLVMAVFSVCKDGVTAAANPELLLVTSAWQSVPDVRQVVLRAYPQQLDNSCSNVVAAVQVAIHAGVIIS